MCVRNQKRAKRFTEDKKHVVTTSGAVWGLSSVRMAHCGLVSPRRDVSGEGTVEARCQGRGNQCCGPSGC